MADEPNQTDNTGWMSDVQRALALILMVTFAFLCIATTLAAFWSAGANNIIADMAKSLQSNLTNMGLIALGFFFGNTMAKMAQDAGQQKVVEKLTGPSPPGGPVAPVPAPVVVVSWWSLLKPEEQAAIEAASPSDGRVNAILTALKSGTAKDPDLSDLVSKGLLTPARAIEIKAKQPKETTI